MNKKLVKIFKEDQEDRYNPKMQNDASLFIKRDKDRKRLVQNLIKKNRLLSAKDYYLAAMIFHHGLSIKDSINAVKFSKTSYKLGYKKSLSFYATCLDRLLIKRGKKQKFGTQYRKKNSKSMWKLLPVDPRTTDDERRKYNLISLKEMKDHINKLNIESLSK